MYSIFNAHTMTTNTFPMVTVTSYDRYDDDGNRSEDSSEDDRSLRAATWAVVCWFY